jgi:hypothetical protein
LQQPEVCIGGSHDDSLNYPTGVRVDRWRCRALTLRLRGLVSGGGHLVGRVGAVPDRPTQLLKGGRTDAGLSPREGAKFHARRSQHEPRRGGDDQTLDTVVAPRVIARPAAPLADDFWSWANVRDAFRRDWEQTKAHFSSNEGQRLNQSAGDTISQALGWQPLPPVGEKSHPPGPPEGQTRRVGDRGRQDWDRWRTRPSCRSGTRAWRPS